MAIEIERKFLLKNELWRPLVKQSYRMRQGYLTEAKSGASVRVRTSEQVSAGLQTDAANRLNATDIERVGNAEKTTAKLNIKSATIGASRLEYEYDIPLDEGLEMLDKLASRQIDKIRHIVQIDAHIWEIDEFLGQNNGLLVAEIELNDELEAFTMPEWAGDEVTSEIRYYNSVLAENPYSNWGNS